MHSAAMRAGHQFCQFALALLDWRSPQVFAVQFDQVESDQHRIVTVALMLNEIEHRQTKVVSDDSQAGEQERARRERNRGDRKPRREVVAVTALSGGHRHRRGGP